MPGTSQAATNREKLMIAQRSRSLIVRDQDTANSLPLRKCLCESAAVWMVVRFDRSRVYRAGVASSDLRCPGMVGRTSVSDRSGFPAARRGGAEGQNVRSA